MTGSILRTPLCRVFCKKLIATHMTKKFLVFIQPLSLLLILSQFTVVHMFIIYFSNIVLILYYSPICACLPSCLFPSQSLTHMYAYEYLISPMYATCSHIQVIFTHFYCFVILGEEFDVCS